MNKPNNNPDWVQDYEVWTTKSGERLRLLEGGELEKIRRDICYIYDEQSTYAYLMSDLSFGVIYELDYWEYLDLEGGLQDREKEFITIGCLFIILMMFEEIYGDFGNAYLYEAKKLDECIKAITYFNPRSEKQKKLKEIIEFDISNLAKPKREEIWDNSKINKQVQEYQNWVIKEVVFNYYKDKADNFWNW